MGAKLVRDNIDRKEWRYPELKAALRPVKDINEYIKLLDQKLLEELGEYFGATNDEDRLLELVDVLEVIIARAYVMGYTLPDLERERQHKLNRLGGFTIGIVWDI